MLLLFVLIAGCAARDGLLVRTLEDSPPESFHGDVLDLRKRSFADADDLRRAIKKADVIYVGEFHDNPAHHDFQLRVVELTHEVDPHLAIGFEMFFEPYQNWLDLYVAGEIDEEEMLRRTQFFTRWGWGWKWYAPIWRFARSKGVPLVALNVPREITRAVSRGGLEALTDEQRAELPELDLTNARHREAFVAAVGDHGHGSGEAFERFYVAQTIWDEGMADAVVRFRRGVGDGCKVVVLAGSRHVESRLGIPSRVARRDPEARHLVLVPFVVAGDAGTPGHEPDWRALVESDRGDFVFLSGEGAGVSGTLGLELDREAAPDDGGLEVRAVVPGGPAETATIRAGDRIRAVDGRRVVDFVSFAMAAGELTVGRRLVFSLSRDDHDVETEVTVAARPSVLPSAAPPPSPTPK